MAKIRMISDEVYYAFIALMEQKKMTEDALMRDLLKIKKPEPPKPTIPIIKEPEPIPDKKKRGNE